MKRLLVVAALLAPQPVLAWFDQGHMVIAASAYRQLAPKTQARVDALVRLNPDYNKWTAGVFEEARASVAFIHAATWPDDIKRSALYQRGSIGDDGPHAFENIGYVDMRMHAYWHFLDLPFSDDGAPVRPPMIPNALTQIRAFTAALSSDAPDEVKSYDLVWLLHLVGDAHQPLHATSRFSRMIPKGDAGGNQERVCLSFVCGLKLHAFWDGALGDSGDPMEATEAAFDLPQPDPARASEADPAKWFEESAALARKVVYTPAIADGAGPFELDAAYQAQARDVARKQAALAAARLAHLLNKALDR